MKKKNAKMMDLEMTTKDLITIGKSIKTFDGNVYEVCGTSVINSITKTIRPISEIYRYVRNVKNEDNIIIAKRKNKHSKLCFTTEIIRKPQNRRGQNSGSRDLMFIATSSSIRKAPKPNRNCRAKEVGILLEETVFSSKSKLQQELNKDGAKKVSFYETSVGTVVVADPYSLLAKYKKK